MKFIHISFIHLSVNASLILLILIRFEFSFNYNSMFHRVVFIDEDYFIYLLFINYASAVMVRYYQFDNATYYLQLLLF